MNVTDQFQKIVVFITDYGLVAILEKMAVPVVPGIVSDGITGKETSHIP